MFGSHQFDCTRVSNDPPVSKRFQQVGCKQPSRKIDNDGVEGQAPSDTESFGSGTDFLHFQNELGLAMSQQHSEELVGINDLCADVLSSPFQSTEVEIKKIIGVEAENTALTEPKKRQSYVYPSESFKALWKYQSRHLKVDGKSSTFCEMQSSLGRGRAPVSRTEPTIRLAAEKFIQSMFQSGNNLSMLKYRHPTSVLAHYGEDSKGVQLVQNLLFCAQEVAENQYERAIKFLNECDKMSSPSGTPIERLAFYFSEALFEKIAVETGRIIPKDLEKKPIDPEELLIPQDISLQIAFNKEHPISQISRLVGIQAVLDHLEEATKVHMIDLKIRNGVHWIILMQALAARSKRHIEHLKITAVGTKWKKMMEETGRQLASFAQSLNLKFTFKVVLVEDILGLNHNLFDLDADEYVAVYAAYTFTSMVGRVDRLNHLMKVMKNMSPCVMIVTEVEANCNSPTFIERFIVSLFYFGAIFDSFADCFKNNETCRADVESIWFRSAIRNVISTEGEEKKIGLTDINMWRASFARLGLVEIELSMSSLDQASLGRQCLPCGRSCTLCTDGKCLTLGWKGMPLCSLSAWKFRFSNDCPVSKKFQQVGCKESSRKVDHDGVEGQVAPDIESFCSGTGFHHFQNELGSAMSQQHFEEFFSIDDLYLDVLSPPLQSSENEIKKITGIEGENTVLTEPKKRLSYAYPSESFKVLWEYQSRRLKLDGNSSTCYVMHSSHGHSRDAMLPTETTIKLAAENFMQSMCQRGNNISMLNHPNPSSVLAHFGEDNDGVQLVQNLLFCAGEVAENHYERAINFLKECDKLSSRSGTPIQRLALYFSEALFRKIAVETGRIMPKDLEKKLVDCEELVLSPNMPLQIAFSIEYPLSQITRLVGIQVVLDHLEEATKVHVIDLKIRNGVHWIILMQALAARRERPIEHLKITAVGTKWKKMMEETGRQLASFAQSLNLNFTFKVVLVEDILDLNHNLFDLDADESVAVYAAFIFSSMVGRVDKLNHFMRVLKNMSPCVMIVAEVEANCNSPTFLGRFLGCLYYFGAVFDSFADCFKNNETSRADTESIWFRSIIRNAISAEGEEQEIGLIGINMWRAFFARLGLVEIDLSISSLEQASMGRQILRCGRSCTLCRDGKCVTFGWKGTPLISLSAWKFQ